MPYFPGPHGTEWEQAEPEWLGLDSRRLGEAVAFAAERETPWPRDLHALIAGGWFEPPPWNEIIGEVRPRGAPCGLVLRHGKIAAEWGDTSRPDMTFSVAKSYLGILAGIACDRGLIGDIDEPVGRTVRDGGFDPPRHHRITWRHLLQQTSEWEGELWGKPDLIDRNRDLAAEGQGRDKGKPRRLQEPGTFWEYNDVRINRLSLALLRRFGESLPSVFKRAVMDPIGASEGWEWHGYRNSVVEIGGQGIASVSGGGHWGGGVFISARDQARVGLLMLRRGMWQDRRLLSERWIELSTTPCPLNPRYGLLWWLNTGRQRFPSASPESYAAVGAGGNLTWIDPSTDLVVILRWTDPAAADGALARVLAALR